jgi:molecular chaperone Hsp33
MTDARPVALGDDRVLPFQLHYPRPPEARISGRLTRLGGLVDESIRRHDYPPRVASLVAEMLALAAGLAATLKFEGIFSLQAQCEGPIKLIVADVTDAGGMRAYARFDAAQVANAPAGAPVPTLLGKGYLAFTVDQGPDTERYQGIVALEGDTLTACAQHYFRQSQQLDTALMLASGERGGAWRAAALILQRLPHGKHAGEDALDPWRHAMLLMATCGIVCSTKWASESRRTGRWSSPAVVRARAPSWCCAACRPRRCKASRSMAA